MLSSTEQSIKMERMAQHPAMLPIFEEQLLAYRLRMNDGVRCGCDLLLFRWVPKFWAHGSVCCACAQRHGLPRASPSRARLRHRKHKYLFNGSKT